MAFTQQRILGALTECRLSANSVQPGAPGSFASRLEAGALGRKAGCRRRGTFRPSSLRGFLMLRAVLPLAAPHSIATDPRDP
jgi:hypothetical protein